MAALDVLAIVLPVSLGAVSEQKKLWEPCSLTSSSVSLQRILISSRDAGVLLGPARVRNIATKTSRAMRIAEKTASPSGIKADYR